MSDERADTSPEPEPDDASDDEAPLLPVGNALRARGIVPILVGVSFGVLGLATDASPRVGVATGLLATLLVVVGILDVAGSFDDEDESLAFRARARELGAPAAAMVGGGVALVLLLCLAVDGRVPIWLSAIGVPAAFLTLVVGVYLAGERLGPWRVDETGHARPIHRRHGFWVVVLTTLLYLPLLGSRSLIDPWEPHYGEVAREILARGDWISLWWAQEGWFWSKPVLTFWLQAVSMAALGVRYEPGQMLSAAGEGREPQPEWALRMPVFLLTLLAVYFLYRAVASSHGRRAGLLGAVVLLTMPQFFFIAVQTVTDMPFAAPMAASLGLFLIGTRIDPERRASTYDVVLGRIRLRLSLYHLVIGGILALVVPQILYLLSRNLSITFDPHLRFDAHRDWFHAGSFGNCGLPGNEACRRFLRPAVGSLEPIVQAFIWIQVVALLMWMSWGERRRQRLVFLAAWLFAALATMAKGPAGIGLPVIAALAWVVGTKRWRDLTRMEIAGGTLVFAGTVLPWFIAMYARHGQEFVDRLLFHDMFKRAFQHVHDTNAGDDVSFRYYVWQLGYAVFPWTGLAPCALLGVVRARVRVSRTTRGADVEGETSGERWGIELALAAWFGAGFALFTLMGTKFHHYSLPIVPPLAMLIGIWLDETCAKRSQTEPALVDGSRYGMVGAVAMGAALLTLLVGRDLAWHVDGRNSQIRLVHVFSYNYGRPWPASLDFAEALWVFTFVAVGSMLLLVPARTRRIGVLATCGASVVFAAWGVSVYFTRIAPHWGQRELFLRYEVERLAEPGQVVAYQLNWHGENFYSGNQLPTFVSSGPRFQTWMDEQKNKGEKVFYFVTEHRRISTLAAELGSLPLEPLTDEALNNKFLLLRARFP